MFLEWVLLVIVFKVHVLLDSTEKECVCVCVCVCDSGLAQKGSLTWRGGGVNLE